MPTVLLVDDDADLVLANQLVLSRRGYSVRTAGSAAEALKQLQAARPDVIVLDVMMESNDAGFALARQVQQLYPGLPTVILTSIHARQSGSMRFEPDSDWLPVARFLDKPVDPAKLADEVAKLLP